MGMFDEIHHNVFFKRAGIIENYFSTKDLEQLLIDYSVGDKVEYSGDYIEAITVLGDFYITVYFPVRDGIIQKPTYGTIEYPWEINSISINNVTYAVIDDDSGEFVWYLGKTNLESLIHFFAFLETARIKYSIKRNCIEIFGGNEKYRIVPFEEEWFILEKFGAMNATFDNLFHVDKASFFSKYEYFCVKPYYNKDEIQCVKNLRTYWDYFAAYVSTYNNYSSVFLRSDQKCVELNNDVCFTEIQEELIPRGH